MKGKVIELLRETGTLESWQKEKTEKQRKESVELTAVKNKFYKQYLHIIKITLLKTYFIKIDYNYKIRGLCLFLKIINSR